MNHNGISIEAVKYGDMPKKQWYVSPNHNSWYYHSPRKQPSEELIPRFLEATLDQPLRLLALGLISQGYTTLPSCSGHYKDEDELNETYNNLVTDAHTIKKSGLELCDVENGEISILKDPSWYLPWDREGFFKAAQGTDGRPEGYLGFVVPKSEAYEVGKAVDDSMKKIKGCRYEVKRDPRGYVFELRVHTGKQKTQDRVWQDLGDSLMLRLCGS